MVCVNDIIKWSDEITERLLWSDGVSGYLTDIFSKTGTPIFRTIAEIENAIREHHAIRVEKDPFLITYKEDDIPDKYKKMRNLAWDVIQELVSPQNEPQIYNSNTRGTLIKQTVEKHGVDKKTVYKYLRKYWQRGKTVNALLPDYTNSGGKGKRKSAGEKKRGRPRKFRDSLGEGVNVTQQDIDNFVKALDKYYYISNGYLPEEVYNLLLKDSYAVDIRFNEQGVMLPIIDQMQNVPSLRQFMYWFREKLDIESSLRSRKGDRNFELNERPILGSSADEGLWATYKYQLDATIGDVYLRSTYNPSEIIGRPVIYIVIDVFSRMIVGYYVGLEGPSWIGMAMALASAMMDKVSFCEKYGKQITKDDWPCQYVPEAIMCDRGEGEGKAIETACRSLDIRIENAASYRADWKGVVERYFKTTNDYVKRRVPGAVLADYNTRMGKDYRLDAALDLYDFNRLMIELILYHNNSHWMKHYTRQEEVIADGVNPIPRDLWDWSIKKSVPRIRDERQIMLSLMPRGAATVTADGIKFNRELVYSCEKAVKEKWYLKANVYGSWKVNISYDPRNMNNIYIWEIGSNDVDTCNLLPRQKNYLNKDINDIEYLFEYQEYEQLKKERDTRQAENDLNAIVGNIIHTAESKLIKSDKSKAAQVRNIRQNRKNEKDLNRENESFSLVNNNQSSPSEIPDSTSSRECPEDIYAFPKQLDLLKRKMQERQNGNK